MYNIASTMAELDMFSKTLTYSFFDEQTDVYIRFADSTHIPNCLLYTSVKIILLNEQ